MLIEGPPSNEVRDVTYNKRKTNEVKTLSQLQNGLLSSQEAVIN